MAAARRPLAARLRGARAALVLVSASTVALTMTVQGVLPAMPLLQERFGIPDTAVGWFTLAYVLPGVIVTIPLGAAVAAVSRRLAFGGALAVYAAAGVAQAFASSYAELLVLRGIQGLTFAVAMPLTVVIIGEAYAGASQVGAFATRQVAVTAGEFALPVLGGLLAALSWRGPLLVQGATFVLAAAALVVLDDRRSPRPAADRPSSAVTAVAAVREQRHGGVVLLLGFARFFFKFALLGYLPLLLVARDATVAEAGVVLAVAAGCAGLTAARVPAALRRVPASRLAGTGAAAIGIALAAFVAVDDLAAAIAIAVLYGVGDGILAVMQDAYLTRAWGRERRLAVAAVAQTSRNLGKSAAPLAMTALVAVGSVQAGFVALAAVAFALAPAFAALGHLDAGFRTPVPAGLMPSEAVTRSAEAP